ncbi:uncharacterized protein LOC121740449 [Aricia agestis]|uniref:uncharacterized protein LOC121740449 n=1 Tax=Aricia agestis TaxID=91739 RepID=UPI001C20C1FC|nr:uncharacterized protein LOC121740449 [Aricia agestis]
MSGLFDALPKVNSCCFCVASLKAACIMICVVELLFSTSYYLYGDGCYINVIQKILTYSIIICDTALALTSIVFFIGLLLDKQITAIMFLWVLLCSVVVKLLVSIVGKIIAMIDGYDKHFGCHTVSSLIVALISAGFAVYFMIIVRSHKDAMS